MNFAGGRSETQVQFEFAASDAQTGFRLHKLEVYNWGTFHEHVWSLEPGGRNTLLTGDIGSGKSTVVDAVTTLLVSPQKLAYNKAAGAEARERTLRTYVLGYYKSERGENSLSTKPIALRDTGHYSVILGQFYNEGFDQHMTLAQVFWQKNPEGQPARLFVTADEVLSIKEDFSGFGREISGLRKRLRERPKVELFDSFPPYSAAFRRRFGIENPQAMDLFNQTVSLKSVGNLTDFVRQHMLEQSSIESRIEALITHFEDLNRSHEAVLKAKAQIQRLEPLVADCTHHRELSLQVSRWRRCRDSLRAWFAHIKQDLLTKRLENLKTEDERIQARLESLSAQRNDEKMKRDELQRAIADNGGDRLQRIESELTTKQSAQNEKRQRWDDYHKLAAEAGIPGLSTADSFIDNRRTIETELSATDKELNIYQNDMTETDFEFRGLKEKDGNLEDEINSLRSRPSNIPAGILSLRQYLCESIGLEEESLPFAGELIRVRENEGDWEGAAERLLHNFGLSLLVPDGLYGKVAVWVDRTHLKNRLVYFRVRKESPSPVSPTAAPDSLSHKLSIKPETEFYHWIEGELHRRFNHVCCDNLDQFRREKKAVTRSGQIKTGGERHEKDDRHALEDRSRYVLGWSNKAKIAALEKRREDLKVRMETLVGIKTTQSEKINRLQIRQSRLNKLTVYGQFGELDWKPLSAEIQALQEEKKELEETSDKLRTLKDRLAKLESEMEKTDNHLEESHRNAERIRYKQEEAHRQMEECKGFLESLAEDVKTETFPIIEEMREEAIGNRAITVESCDNREKDMREWLQNRIDGEDKKISRLGEKIVSAMAAYGKDYPLETRETDATLEASGEYQNMLDRLKSDDLPRFEKRFKELLNENTIREVANFQSQLGREQQTIKDRMGQINKSLTDIDYNPGRYIVLEASVSPDPEIRDFRQDLRACTEGSMTGSEEEAYSESKFLQVKQMIERFRGREGTTELDLRWTRKVTDVRNWFVFSASERWREDDTEYEHYTDSGGKSGGQKEKLAYTVLAAGLAYQFGLEFGEIRSRSFRFVVIDEAFGRGSDESARYGLELFKRLNLQLLIVTPLQKIHVIEPYVSVVGFVHNQDGRLSFLRNLTVEEYWAEKEKAVEAKRMLQNRDKIDEGNVEEDEDVEDLEAK